VARAASAATSAAARRRRGAGTTASPITVDSSSAVDLKAIETVAQSFLEHAKTFDSLLEEALLKIRNEKLKGRGTAAYVQIKDEDNQSKIKGVRKRYSRF
jgi:hypothetical protein